MVVGYRKKVNRVGDELTNLVPNNEVIERLEKIKYLLITINERLNCGEQYKTVKSKLKGG